MAPDKEAEELYLQFFQQRGWESFPYQRELLGYYRQGYHGLLNAPTGSGKTYGIWIPVLVDWLLKNGGKPAQPGTGVLALWITPVRALATDIARALQEAADQLGTGWKVAVRTGDTTAAEKAKQKAKPPQCLVTTPESIHLLLCSPAYPQLLGQLQVVVVDEWHELLGSKRGVALQLALARLRAMQPLLRLWGVSATIGNMEEGLQVLLGQGHACQPHTVVRAQLSKQIEIQSLMPTEVENYPWGGHLGIRMLPQVLQLVQQGTTTLIFTNTRSQCEIWYGKLLQAAPELAGTIALHHGSLGEEVRSWVENSLHTGGLRAVVCTSSLDLGVDYASVDQIIQIGGPKGISRFLQRAGRSGHRPGALSRIWFVPTHSLELVEAAALRTSIAAGIAEAKTPVVRAWDVLAQYLVTMAVGEGFREAPLYEEVKTCHAYTSMSREEWLQVLQFVHTGGTALAQYSDFQKLVLDDGLYTVKNKRIAMRHRLSIGTITSEPSIAVKMMNGGYVGSMEEYWITRLRPGDHFVFAGQTLELVQVKDNTARVRPSRAKQALIPSWLGGRMNLSSMLAAQIREKLRLWAQQQAPDVEMQHLAPLLQRQQLLSHLPSPAEFLIEHLKTKEGNHFFFYTFEGRFLNEGMGSLLAYRISQQRPVTFSIAMNDYGFELLTDADLKPEDFLEEDLFSTTNLVDDVYRGMNAAELAGRKFRDIAQIAGLTFAGMPGQPIKARHLQANSRLLFKVLLDYEPNNLFIRQAYEEVLYDQLEEDRLRRVLSDIQHQKIIVKKLETASPFCFPIMVERIRAKVTSEKLEDRVAKMIKQLEGSASPKQKKTKREPSTKA